MGGIGHSKLAEVLSSVTSNRLQFWLTSILNSALTVKLILGINLLSYASRRRVGMDERMKDDEEINDFSRPAIGEGIEEIVRFTLIPMRVPQSHSTTGLQPRAQGSARTAPG